jgi:creatinine amidohydrolase
MSHHVKWSHLLPAEFVARRDACPLVYLPIGLCEPHGHVAALGMDMLKADAICDAAARRNGGIVAPTQGYTIHEAGFHAPWLAETVGEHDGHMAAISPEAMCHVFLYQLRAFANAGFRAVIAISGHGGGNERDLAAWGTAFTEQFGLPVRVIMEFALAPDFPGDHAGKYEVSSLMHLHPELVDLSRLDRAHEPGVSRLAQGGNAGESSSAYGAAINAQVQDNLSTVARDMLDQGTRAEIARPIPFAPVEALYQALYTQRHTWVSNNLRPGQAPAPDGSRWSVNR